MHGAMHGLADALDADSAYLTPEQTKLLQSGAGTGPADVGLDLTRQYYLRVVAARDNSPAARAGLRPGDFIRMIDAPADARDVGVGRHAAAAGRAGDDGDARRPARQRRRAARRWS